MGISHVSFSKITILSLIVGLVVGCGAGYLGARIRYQPKINDYENQITNLTAEVSGLNSTVSTLEMSISDLEKNVSNYESKISQLESYYESQVYGLNASVSNYISQISNLESNLAEAERTITGYERQTADLEFQISNFELQASNLETKISNFELQISFMETQLSNLQHQVDSYYAEIVSLQSRLNNILDVEVIQRYEWAYDSLLWSERYQWELPIPISLYVEYNERSRPASWSDWVDMAEDPKDDYYLTQMVQQISSAASSEGLTEIEKVNFVAAFVQSLPYTVDYVTAPWDEHPRYPLETLFDGGGDCEDTSILAAALLDKMGYDVALIFLHNEDHVAVGVSLEGARGSYYSYMNKKFYYLETTGEGWEMGEIPSDFTDTTSFIYPL